MEQKFSASDKIDKLLVATLFVFAAFSMFSISVTQIACGLGGFLWLLRTHLTDTWKEQRWPLGIPFLLFVVACLIAVANAYDPSYSYKPLKKLFEFLIFFWVLNCVKENGMRDLLSLALIASATLAGLFGFYQAWESGVIIENRVAGTLSVYMTFAGLLMLVGMHALGRALFRRPTQPWLWISIGIIIICLLFTLTRQAWLGFLMGLIFLVFIWRKKILWLLPVLMLTAYIASPLSVQTRLKNMFSGNDYTFEMRKALWTSGWEIFKDYPLTGCGFRCVDLVNSQYPDPTGLVKRLRGMHNNFIQLAVDTGILGLTAWLGIWFCFFRLLFRKAVDRERDPPENWIVFGSAAAGLAFLAGGFFETNYYDSEVVMVLYFIMALPFTSSRTETPIQ